MASSDAVPVPRKNTAFRVTFPLYDADGDLVTGATSLDSEVSKDGGTFADCTNEATEIATSSGVYYLELTATEMNADTVAVIVKSGNAKTQALVFYPEELGDIRVNAGQIGGTAQTGRDLGASVLLSSGTGTGQLDFTSGVVKANLAQILGTALTETSGQIAAAFKKFFDKASPTGTINSLPDAVAGAASGVAIVGSNMGTVASVTGAVGSVTGNVGGNVAGSVASVTAGVTVTTNNDKTGYGLSSAAVQAIWDALTSALTTVGSIGKLLVTNIDAAISSRLASASYTAPLDAAGTRSAVGLASANLDTQLSAIDDYLDTEVAAIKAKTDNLPSDPADESAVEDAITAAQAAILAGITASVNAVWDEDVASHLTAGSTGEALSNAGGAGTPATPEEIADAVWDEILGDHLADATTGEALGAVLGLPSNSDIAEAIWAIVLEDGGDEGPITAEMVQRAILAYFAGPVDGGGTNEITYLSRDGSRARIVQRGVDEYGNRGSVDLDLDA